MIIWMLWNHSIDTGAVASRYFFYLEIVHPALGCAIKSGIYRDLASLQARIDAAQLLGWRPFAFRLQRITRST